MGVILAMVFLEAYENTRTSAAIPVKRSVAPKEISGTGLQPVNNSSLKAPSPVASILRALAPL
jgi:hypothetical protein